MVHQPQTFQRSESQCNLAGDFFFRCWVFWWNAFAVDRRTLNSFVSSVLTQVLQVYHWNGQRRRRRRVAVRLVKRACVWMALRVGLVLLAPYLCPTALFVLLLLLGTCRRSSRFGSIVGSSTPSTTTATTASGEAIEDRRSFAAAVLPEEAAVGSSSLAPRNKSLRRPAVSMAATGIVSGDLPAQLQATVSNGLGLRGMDQSRDGDGVTGGDTGGDTGGGIGFLGRGQGAADAVPAHYRTTTTRSGRVIIKEPLPEPVAADSGRRASGKRGRRRSSRTKQTARKSTGGKAPRRVGGWSAIANLIYLDFLAPTSGLGVVGHCRRLANP